MNLYEFKEHEGVYIYRIENIDVLIDKNGVHPTITTRKLYPIDSSLVEKVKECIICFFDKRLKRTIFEGCKAMRNDMRNK